MCCRFKTTVASACLTVALPPLPEFMPPMGLFLPWVVEACHLPTGYAKGKELAIQLLCKMTITHWHTPPLPDHLTHFYHLMHTALQPHSVSHPLYSAASCFTLLCCRACVLWP